MQMMSCYQHAEKPGSPALPTLALEAIHSDTAVAIGYS